MTEHEYRWTMGDGRDSQFYSDENGRIVGEVGIIGTGRNKYYATVYPNATESISLGVYITHIFGTLAVEKYWEIQNRTLLGE